MKLFLTRFKNYSVHPFIWTKEKTFNTYVFFVKTALPLLIECLYFEMTNKILETDSESIVTISDEEILVSQSLGPSVQSSFYYIKGWFV